MPHVAKEIFPEGHPRRALFERKGSVLVGDVHPEVAEVAGAMTPVPGGVGPLTIAMLMANTLKAAELRLAVVDRRSSIVPSSIVHAESGADRRDCDREELRARALRERGVPTIDADDVVHESLGPGTPTTKAIASAVRQRVSASRTAASTVPASARRCFGDAESRLRLEAIIHPVVYETIRRWYERLEGPMGVASVPLLYETRREGDFDFVAVTVCSPEQQLQRIVAARQAFQRTKPAQRIAAQMPAGREGAARAILSSSPAAHARRPITRSKSC